MHLSKFVAPAAVMCLALAASAAEPHVVNLNVIATDSKGQPVTDLTAADFQVTDQGKPQEIIYFRSAATEGHKLGELGPHEFANRSGEPAGNSTLILMDLLNSRMSDRGFSSADIARDLQGLESAGSLYFYLLTKDAKLSAVRPLPDGPADLKKEPEPWTRNIRSVLDEALKKVNKLRPGDRLIDTQVKQTYTALNTVATTLAMMPGQHSVIWISHGVPMSVRLESDAGDVKYTALLKQLAAICDRGRTVIYTVDPTGNTPTDDLGMSSVETMEAVAEHTGGMAFRGDRITAVTRLAMTGGAASYRIGYPLGADGWDGKLHKIKVICARKGVDVVARQGFYADLPAPGELDNAAMQTAVNSPFDKPDVSLRVAVAPGKTPQSLRFRILLDPADLLLAHQGDRYSGQVTVAFLQLTAQGPKAISKPVVDSVSLTQAQYEAAAKAGILLEEELPAVGADIRRVRVIVYDRGGGLTGSVTVPAGSQ